MPNLFSSDWFLRSAAEVFFPGHGAAPGTVDVEGRLYDVLVRADGCPLHGPLVDFLEPRPVGLPGPVEACATAFLPAVARDLVCVVDGAPLGRRAGQSPAPRVEWGGFSKWEQLVQRCAGRSRNAFHRHDKKLKKLATDVGPTRFSLDEPDHRLLEDALFWKSRQLRRTRRFDRFASTRNRRFCTPFWPPGT